jgi:uncharacterized DUF497 family protein
MKFGWDPNKAASNLARHGISFERAKLVFEDLLLEELDEDPDPDELRFKATGMAAGILITVVYTERTDDKKRLVIWLISARRPAPHERRKYEEG